MVVQIPLFIYPLVQQVHSRNFFKSQCFGALMVKCSMRRQCRYFQRELSSASRTSGKVTYHIFYLSCGDFHLSLGDTGRSCSSPGAIQDLQTKAKTCSMFIREQFAIS